MNIKHVFLKIGKVTLYTIIIAIITLLLGEGVLRILKIHPQLREEWLFKAFDMKWRILDKDQLLSIPKFDTYDYFNTDADQLKIVALGDSFTEGYPEVIDDSYPMQLQRYLDQAGINANVINAGMGFSGTDQHLSLFKNKILPKIVPDIVIWQFCYNDYWDNITLSLYRINEKGKLEPKGITDHWIYQRDKIFNAIPLPKKIKSGSYLIRLILKATESQEKLSLLPAQYKLHPELFGYDKSMLALKEIQELAKKYNFKLFIVMVDLQLRHIQEEQQNINKDVEWVFNDYYLQEKTLHAEPDFLNTEFKTEDIAFVNTNFPGELKNSFISTSLYADDISDTTTKQGYKHYNKYGYWLFAQKIGTYLIEYLK